MRRRKSSSRPQSTTRVRRDPPATPVVRDTTDPLAREELDAVWKAVGDLRGEPAFEAMVNEARAYRSGFTRRAALIAASLVGVAAIGATVWLSQSSVDPGVRYATAIGERRTVALADGSTLTLDANSAVTVRFTRDQRALELESGRARFAVERDTQRPFVVDAEAAQVTALGTAFDVTWNGREAHVVMLEGRAAVVADGPNEGPDAQRLEVVVGEAVRANTRGVLSKQDDVELDAAAAWTSGRLVFRDAPLSEVIEQVNRYTDTTFAIGDPSLRDMRVRATFETDNTAAIADALTLGFGLQTRDLAGRTYLYAPTEPR